MFGIATNKSAEVWKAWLEELFENQWSKNCLDSQLSGD